MASLPALALPPPRNWQDFEDLCCDLWRQLWNDPDIQHNGRIGQVQKGVDIYGRPDKGSNWGGVQCKLKNPLYESRLTVTELEDEIAQARTFRPNLDRLVIATTAPRDASLQAEVRQLDEKERQAGSFSITVLFWEDIALRLRDFPVVMRKYYPGAFPQLEPLIESLIHYLQQQGLESDPRSLSKKLEVVIRSDPEMDYVALLPAFSSPDTDVAADLSVLMVYISGIEVINHDESPTRIQRMWVTLGDAQTQAEMVPIEIKEEDLRGPSRIPARDQQQYELKFTAVFKGPPQHDWRERVRLRAKTIGLSEIDTKLHGFE